MTSDTIIIKAEHISKSFAGVKALDDVDITIYSGQVNTIVGENGAGKSTLMKILAGIYQDYEGRLFLDNYPISFADPKDAQNHGVAIIHQELNLVPNLSIAENIYLGRESTNRLGFIADKNLRRQTIDLLEQLNLDVDPSTPVAQLKVGQQQIVEIAKALSYNARLLVMDEPTSAISDKEVTILFDLIHDLVSKGVAIVYITHKLDELFKIGDQITVLRDGKCIASRPLAGLEHDDVVRMMVGRDIDTFFVKDHSKTEEIGFRVEKLSLAHPKRKNDYLFHDISFRVHKGEVLGLFGLMGAGRSELLETIFGVFNLSLGQIYVEEQPVTISSPHDAIDAGIGLVPENRQIEGLVLDMTVAENTSLANLEPVLWHGFLSSRLEEQFTQSFIDRLNIKTSSVHSAIETLSGGNQQKVVLAKWLATNPKILLLDEPTRGIDINAKTEIYRLINTLAQSGLAIVMVSSELPEILAIADRILVLSRGRLAGEFPGEEATEEELLKAAVSAVASRS